MELPKEVTVFINSRGKALRYGLTLIGMYIVCSFAFSGRLPYGVMIGISTSILGVLLIVFMVKKDKSTKSKLILSELGIQEFKNGKETSILWTEPHQTYYDATTFISIGIPLTTVSETQVVAPNKNIRINYPNEGFQNTLIELSTKYLLQQLNTKLHHRKTLDFGPIELNRETIFIKKNKYPLKEVTSVGIENGHLKLKLKSQWFSTKLAVSEIPDFLCLVTILEDRIRVNIN